MKPVIVRVFSFHRQRNIVGHVRFDASIFPLLKSDNPYNNFERRTGKVTSNGPSFSQMLCEDRTLAHISATLGIVVSSFDQQTEKMSWCMNTWHLIAYLREDRDPI